MIAVLYARYSPRPTKIGTAPADGPDTRQDTNCESIETQTERMVSYCTAKAWHIGERHHDKDLSGGRADNRPGLDAALADAVGLGDKGCLVVYSLSRLARNTRDALDIAEKLNAAGSSLVSLHESIDTTTPAGRLFFTILAAVAAWEREEISHRTSDAMRRHQSTGRCMGSRPPYGKRIVMVKNAQGQKIRMLEDNPDEIEALRKIRLLRSAGFGCKTIVKKLDELKIRARNGGKWNPVCIMRIVKADGMTSNATQNNAITADEEAEEILA